MAGRTHRPCHQRRSGGANEAGHALVMQLVEESEPLHKITIIPRGRAYLGATMQLPEKDRLMEGKIKLEGILAGCMGGRVAEELCFGDITSGASADLKEATRIARLMVCDWGMNEDLGHQTFGAHEELMFLGREVSRNQDYSEDTARKIDGEVKGILDRSYKRATELLTKHRDKLEIIATLLLERETLEGIDVEEIVEHGRLLTAAERKEKEPAEESKDEKPAAESKDKKPAAESRDEEPATERREKRPAEESKNKEKDLFDVEVEPQVAQEKTEDSGRDGD